MELGDVGSAGISLRGGQNLSSAFFFILCGFSAADSRTVAPATPAALDSVCVLQPVLSARTSLMFSSCELFEMRRLGQAETHQQVHRTSVFFLRPKETSFQKVLLLHGDSCRGGL